MLKRSVFLATGFAIAIVVGVPTLGSAGVVVGSPDQVSGTIVISDAAARISAAQSSTAADASASTSDSSSSSGSVSDATVETNGSHSSASQSTDSTPSGDAIDDRTNASTHPQSSSRTGRNATGVTARLSASGGHTIVRTSPSKPSAPSAPTGPKSCPGNVDGTPSTVPGGAASDDGLQGTTNADLAAFALEYNANRVVNCLQPIPLANIRFDKCLQDRMFWIAEDPSTNPASAWGHSVPRSDGKKMVGCDGDIAGGMGDTGTTAADKWWESTDHRASLYQPKWGDSFSNVCVGFAISHGGIPNDPTAFSRESARWEDCSTFGD